MSITNKLGAFLSLVFFFFLPEVCHSQEPGKFELISVGIRAGENLGGIPPEERHKFNQYDVFGTFGLPGSWEWPRGWAGRYLWFASAGMLQGGGENGFITTTGPEVEFTRRDWNISLEFGTGLAFISDRQFGDQEFGGHVQIVAQGGISYHFPGNIVGGWRFQHFSDAGLYGSNNRGVDLHFIEFSYRL
jgi:hypothetical protein